MHMVISYVKAGYVLTYFYCYKIPVVRCALEVHVPLALLSYVSSDTVAWNVLGSFLFQCVFCTVVAFLLLLSFSANIFGTFM